VEGGSSVYILPTVACWCSLRALCHCARWRTAGRRRHGDRRRQWQAAQPRRRLLSAAERQGQQGRLQDGEWWSCIMKACHSLRKGAAAAAAAHWLRVPPCSSASPCNHHLVCRSSPRRPRRTRRRATTRSMRSPLGSTGGRTWCPADHDGDCTCVAAHAIPLSVQFGTCFREFGRNSIRTSCVSRSLWSTWSQRAVARSPWHHLLQVAGGAPDARRSIHPPRLSARARTDAGLASWRAHPRA